MMLITMLLILATLIMMLGLTKSKRLLQREFILILDVKLIVLMPLNISRLLRAWSKMTFPTFLQMLPEFPKSFIH